MAMMVLLHGGGAPGVSTTVGALTASWPGRVLAVDADPHGGALIPGWLGPWWVGGRVDATRSVVSFASATRHLTAVPDEGLVGHTQDVPGAGHARVLGGVSNRAQASAIGPDGWSRLASATRDLTTDGGPDLLIDAGRWSPDTPWPLITEADLVLIGLRPTLRHTAAAAPLITTLRQAVPAERIAAAVSASTRGAAENTARALDIPVAFELPDDPVGARVFSDGTSQPRRSPLLRASHVAGRRLLCRLTPYAHFTEQPSTPHTVTTAAVHGGGR